MRENARAIVTTIAMLSVAAMLVACATDTGPSDQTPAGETSTPTSPTEDTEEAPPQGNTDPTPSPGDADEEEPPDGLDAVELPDPEDVSTWVATSVGIGPVEIGMSIDDVAALLGVSVEVDERGSIADESQRCRTTVGQDPWVLVAAFADGTVRSIQMNSDQTQAVYGLPQIATQADLYDALGEPDDDAWGPGGSPAWVIEEGEGTSALLAIGDRVDETRPVRFIVTDFSYLTDKGAEMWFPICYD